jgi:hypothetical protein
VVSFVRLRNGTGGNAHRDRTGLLAIAMPRVCCLDFQAFQASVTPAALPRDAGAFADDARRSLLLRSLLGKEVSRRRCVRALR